MSVREQELQKKVETQHSMLRVWEYRYEQLNNENMQLRATITKLEKERDTQLKNVAKKTSKINEALFTL